MKLDDPYEFEVMVWYWDVLMRKVMGKIGWDVSDRHYTTLTKATFPHDRKVPNFDVSSEAFVVLVYENCYQKWTKTMEWKQANPGQKLPTRSKTNKNDPIFKTIYTSQDSGQQKNGGWTNLGIERYNGIYDAISKVKFNDFSMDPDAPDPTDVNPDFDKFELDCLKKMRDLLGLTADNR